MRTHLFPKINQFKYFLFWFCQHGRDYPLQKIGDKYPGFCFSYVLETTKYQLYIIAAFAQLLELQKLSINVLFGINANPGIYTK